METSNAKTYITDGSGSYGDSSCWLSIAHQIAELRREIGESECGIKESIHNQSLSMGKDFCDLNKNVSDNSHRNVIEILTNRSEIKDSTCALDKSIMENRFFLAEKVDKESDIIKLQLNAFERQTAENFCQVRSEVKDSERRILDRLTTDKLDEKNEVIDRLRHDNRHKDIELFIGNRFASIEALVNSVKQTQEVTNKSIIFGNGTNTTKNNTNNA